jgi:hypothetical protein
MRRDVSDDVKDWFAAVPGLVNEIELLAWTHRGVSPFIHASAPDLSDAGGSDVRVKMIPRRFWDENPARSVEADTLRKQLRHEYDAISFCPTKQSVCVMTMRTLQASRICVFNFNVKLIRGVEIARALTTATRAEDLADAFAWIEGTWSSHAAAQGTLHSTWGRALSLQGTITSCGTAPVPSRALNNEVAYTIFRDLQLEFDVRLKGLRSATHLNGRQGVVRDEDPVDDERWRFRLDDGTWVSVKAVNFEHIRRGDYRRRSP